MQPTSVILSALQTLLAEDVTTLANATALHVHLIKAPFTPGDNTDFTTLTEADFTGHTALHAGTGNQQMFRDPVTGELVVQMLEPAGGWHWVTGDTVNLPQTIYGYVLTDHTDLITYASSLLPTPVLLQAAGDGVNVDQVKFNFVLEPLS